MSEVKLCIVHDLIKSPISSNIYVPAIPTLVKAFDVSVEKINLTVTVFL